MFIDICLGVYSYSMPRRLFSRLLPSWLTALRMYTTMRFGIVQPALGFE